MTTGRIIKRFDKALAAALFAAGPAMPLLAQAAAPVSELPASREVVQPLPPQAASDLSEALRTLGKNSQDGDALLKAGWASLELDNTDAAIGFFARAEAVPSSAAEAKAGLGAVLVDRKRPVEAIQYFNDAEAAGAKLGVHAAQRGLAYDLVGDNAKAQDYYRESLQAKPSDQVTQWLALSQAIGGNQPASEATLLPLLQRRDLSAYRTRAFALAALGKTEEATSIANTVMPQSLSGRIVPYLRYMPKLTRAQQAAAGIFGHFPEADAIGHDDPRIAEYASGAKPAAVASALDTRLTPAGAPLGGTARPAAPPLATQMAVAKELPAKELPPKELPPKELPPREVAARELPAKELPPKELPARDAASAATLAKADPDPRPAFSLTPSTPPPAAEKPAPAAAPTPTPTLTPAPAPSAPPAPRPERAHVADVFADLGGQKIAAAVPSAGAVDVTKIEPARDLPKPPPEEPKADKDAKADKDTKSGKDAKDAKDTKAGKGAKDTKSAKEAKKDAKPKKPVNPSRIWVQLASGRDRDALAFDWRRFTRENAKLLSARDAYVAKYGRSSRLLTGPFASEKEANAFIAKLKKAGITALSFTSDPGEAVDPLPGT